MPFVNVGDRSVWVAIPRYDSDGNVYDAGGQPINQDYVDRMDAQAAAEQQAFQDLKTTDPHAYYTQLAQQYADGAFSGWSSNNAWGNYSLALSSLDSLKDVDPTAYYNAKLSLLGRQMGWNHGQNTSDRNSEWMQQVQNMLPEMAKYGISTDQVNKTLNTNFADASQTNQQRIATEAATGGGGFNFKTDVLPGLQFIGGAALSVAVPGLSQLALPIGESILGAGAVGAQTLGSAIVGSTTSAITAAVTGKDIGKAAITGAIGGGVAAATPEMMSQIVGGGDSILGMSRIADVANSVGMTTSQVAGLVSNALTTVIASAAINGDTSNLGQKLVNSLASTVIGNYAGNLTASIVPDDLNKVANVVGSIGKVSTSALLNNQDLSTSIINNIGTIIGSAAQPTKYTSIVDMTRSADNAAATFSPDQLNTNTTPDSNLVNLSAPSANLSAPSNEGTSDATFISSENRSLDNLVAPSAVDNGQLTVTNQGGDDREGTVTVSQISPEEQMYNDLLDQGFSREDATTIVNKMYPESATGDTNIEITGVNNPDLAGTGNIIPATGDSGTMSTYGGDIPVNILDVAPSNIKPPSNTPTITLPGGTKDTASTDKTTTTAPSSSGGGGGGGTDSSAATSSADTTATTSSADTTSSTSSADTTAATSPTSSVTNGNVTTSNDIVTKIATPVTSTLNSDGSITTYYSDGTSKTTGTSTADTTGTNTTNVVGTNTADTTGTNTTNTTNVVGTNTADTTGTNTTGTNTTGTNTTSGTDVLASNTGSGTGSGIDVLSTNTGTGSGTDVLASGTGTGTGTGTGDGTGTGSGTGTGTGTGTGSGNGSGSGSGTGSGSGSGSNVGLKIGLTTKEILDLISASKGNTKVASSSTPASSTITDLTPGLTKGSAFKFASEPKFVDQLTPQSNQAQPDYTQQIEKAAQGGLISVFAEGGEVPETPAAPSPTLRPGIVQGRQFRPVFHHFGAQFAGYQPQKFADGGDVEQEHVPQFYSEGGLNSLENTYVKGEGDGTSDSVPAMLANGEFVIPADVVSKLGNGSNDAGASVLSEFLATIREHAQNHDPKKLPPESKGALAYLLDAKRKVG